LPHLAIERWAKSADLPPDSPVVLTLEGPHGLIIHAVTNAAAERGARPGARLTDARALDPALVAAPADPEGDSALVQRLARWAGRWSPLVEADDDGLRLDVNGIAHLFGGEEAAGARYRATLRADRSHDARCDRPTAARLGMPAGQRQITAAVAFAMQDAVRKT
jgi:nucleotidyltransferase/DNA polymerase involved in DNA repair